MKLKIVAFCLIAINYTHAMDNDKPSLHKMIWLRQLTNEKQLTDIDVNKKGRNGETPLMLAVKRNNVEAVKILLTAKAILDIRNPDGFTVFHHAASHGNPEIMKLLLEVNAEQKKLDIDCKNNFNATPLMIAVDRCHHQVAKQLVQEGANIHKEYGYPPFPLLYHAAKHHSPETVRILLEAGAEPNENWPLITPLNVAFDDEVIRLLKEAGGKKGCSCVIV